MAGNCFGTVNGRPKIPAYANDATVIDQLDSLQASR